MALKSTPSIADRFLRGYLRLGWRGFPRLWAISGRSSESMLHATVANGPVLELSPFSLIDSIVLREGYYESEVIDAVVADLDDGVFWDVGAHFGLHAVTAKFRRPRARVVCFEPSIEMLGRLARNRDLNSLDIEVVGIGLSSRSGLENLFLGPKGNLGMSTLSPWSGACYSGRQIAAVAAGDDLVAMGGVPEPTVMKLDVEGHEPEVLEGMKRTLRSATLRTVVFEDSTDEATKTKGILRDAGLRWERLVRRENTGHSLANFVARRVSVS